MKLLRVRCLEFELLGESFCCEGLCVFEFSMILNSCIVTYESISNLIYFLAVFSIPKVDPL